MQVCTFTNCLGGAGLGIALLFGACNGSSSPPARTPTETSAQTPSDSAGAPSAAVASDVARVPEANSETWEGEKEATANASATPKAGEETRTTEAIQKVILDNRPSIRACYETARKELPDLKGTMTIHFVLDPEGKVKSAEPNIERSDLKSPQVTECAIAALKRLKFPPSSRGMDTTVNYPFDFKP